MLFVVLTALIAVTAFLTVVRDVRRDGYGSRPAPLSHHGWGGVAAPSSPFSASLDR